MTKVKCKVCEREIDSRGISGHMRTHQGKPHSETKRYVLEDKPVDNPEIDGVINYPASKTTSKPASRTTSKPTRKSTSKPTGKVKKDPRGERKTEKEHKEEWKGFFQ